MKYCIKRFIVFCMLVLFYSCKDEDLMIERIPYSGNELRIDGYYYRHPNPDNTKVLFFYRNGVMINILRYFPTTDLTVVDKNLPDRYAELKNDKLSFQVFIIKGSTIQYSGWGTSTGSGRPSFKSIGTIENDTTFRIIKTINSRKGQEFEKNDVYHFRQFSLKPDSTNNFIP